MIEWLAPLGSSSLNKNPMAISLPQEKWDMVPIAQGQVQSQKVAKIRAFTLYAKTSTLHFSSPKGLANLTFLPKFPCLCSGNKWSLTDLSLGLIPRPWQHQYKKGVSGNAPWMGSWDETAPSALSK